MWFAVAVVVLPLAVSAGVLLVRTGASFHALGDNAQNELHTRDVGRHLVLLGPYSRDGWNHLGPAMYYLLAVPYRLTGSNSVGMYVGALSINAVALAGMVVVAWRRGGPLVCLLTALGLATVVLNLGPDFLRDPWNPFVTVLPFGLFVFLVWELTAEQLWALPAATAVGTFLVQTHVGYLPLVGPLLVAGAAWLLILNRRRAPRVDGAPVGWRRFVPAATATAIVLVVGWTPPVLGVVLHLPGNLATATRYFVDGKATHSLIDGYRVVADQFSTRPEWATGARAANPFSSEPMSLYRAATPWLVAPFLLATVFAWRRRVTDAVRLAAVVAVASLVGGIAVSRTIGPIYAYRLRWTWMLAMPAALLVGWMLCVAARQMAKPRYTTALLISIALAALALSTASTASAATRSMPEQHDSATLGKLFRPLVRTLPKRDGVVIVAATTFGSIGYGVGAVLWFERTGIPVRVFDTQDVQQGLGSRRVYHSGPVRAVATFADDDMFDALLRNPGKRLVAYQGTPPDRRMEVAAQVAPLQQQFQQGQISERELLIRTAPLVNRLGHTIGVFLDK